MRSTVVLIPDEGGVYVAYVPAVPGCVTQGCSVEEALARAQEAAEFVVAHLAETEQEVSIEHGIAVLGAVEVAIPVTA
jgi:predicted RNase H-like HicB family nuclease